MKIGIIIQVRMSSRRFPGKVLHEIQGKPLLGYLVERLKLCQNNSELIVATSSEESDQPVYDYCETNGVKCFRGSLDSVAERFADAIKEYQLDAFVRICGDSPMVDPQIVDQGLKVFLDNDYEIVTNCLKKTFPQGQGFEILKSQTFLEGYKNFHTPDHFEHHTCYFYEHADDFNICNIETGDKDYSSLDLCVDDPEDAERLAKVLEQMDRPFTDYGWRELVGLYNQQEKATVN